MSKYDVGWKERIILEKKHCKKQLEDVKSAIKGCKGQYGTPIHQYRKERDMLKVALEVYDNILNDSLVDEDHEYSDGSTFGDLKEKVLEELGREDVTGGDF